MSNRTPAKRQGSMAEFVDGLFMQGTTWQDLETKAKAEAKKRGVPTLNDMSKLKAHVKYRPRQAKWKVEMNHQQVKMWRVETKPAEDLILFRLAGARTSLIEIAHSSNLPHVEVFADEVDRLAKRLEQHVRSNTGG